MSRANVFNEMMKTLGERMRQAREARGLSGEELAIAVGYKHQSAISNLENRATGTGGTKITKIANALRVPVQWLLEGPDSLEVPFSEPSYTVIDPAPRINQTIHQPQPGYAVDASLTEATQLFRQLGTAQRLKAIQYMQQLIQEGPLASETGFGNRDSVPRQKAA